MDKEVVASKDFMVEIAERNIASGVELELWEKEIDRQRILKLLEECNFKTDDILVAIGLAASVPSKQWPAACYAELVNMIRNKRTDLRFVLLGDVFDQGADVAWNEDVVNLCGRLTLRETVALLRHVTLYVGNDTGLMHIASACGCSVVEVSSLAIDGDMSYGISSNTRFAPWAKKAIIVQPARQLGDCKGMCWMPYAHCIRQVTTETVFKAVSKLLCNKMV